MTKDFILVKDVVNKYIIPQNFKVVICDTKFKQLLEINFKDFYNKVFNINTPELDLIFNSFVKAISIQYDENIVLIMIY